MSTAMKWILYIAIGGVIYYLGYRWYKYSQCTKAIAVGATGETRYGTNATTGTNPSGNVPVNPTPGTTPTKCSFWKSNGY